MCNNCTIFAKVPQIALPKKNNRNGSIDTNPFGTKTMKRLLLEELKAQKMNLVSNVKESNPTIFRVYNLFVCILFITFSFSCDNPDYSLESGRSEELKRISSDGDFKELCALMVIFTDDVIKKVETLDKNQLEQLKLLVENRNKLNNMEVNQLSTMLNIQSYDLDKINNKMNMLKSRHRLMYSITKEEMENIVSKSTQKNLKVIAKCKAGFNSCMGKAAATGLSGLMACSATGVFAAACGVAVTASTIFEYDGCAHTFCGKGIFDL